MTPLDAIYGLTSDVIATGKVPRDWEDVFHYAQKTPYEAVAGRKICLRVFLKVSEYYRLLEKYYD